MPYNTPEQRICAVCKINKPMTDFCFNGHGAYGRNSRCKNCQKIKMKEWKVNNPIRFKSYYYRARYGITEEIYQKMLKLQNNVCAICSTSNGKRRLSVDHCHKTGKIRGLLCNNCNRYLGLIKDNASNLIKYLGGINNGITV